MREPREQNTTQHGTFGTWQQQCLSLGLHVWTIALKEDVHSTDTQWNLLEKKKHVGAHEGHGLGNPEEKKAFLKTAKTGEGKKKIYFDVIKKNQLIVKYKSLYIWKYLTFFI